MCYHLIFYEIVIMVKGFTSTYLLNEPLVKTFEQKNITSKCRISLFYSFIGDSSLEIYYIFCYEQLCHCSYVHVCKF